MHKVEFIYMYVYAINVCTHTRISNSRMCTKNRGGTVRDERFNRVLRREKERAYVYYVNREKKGETCIRAKESGVASSRWSTYAL